MESPKFYQQSAVEVLSQLQSNENGLKKEVIQQRLEEYGKNIIEVRDKWKYWKMFVNSINDVLTWLLFGASVVSFIMDDVVTSVIFFVIIVLNIALNFLQEFKAENIMQSLKGFIRETAHVKRSGEIVDIPVAELVPGDIIVLEEGDAVPADIRILHANKLQVNSFAITGESNPQYKSDAPINREVSFADQTNMVFMGATIATGDGIGVVTATGHNTMFGNIAKLSSEIERDRTPLQKELDKMAKKNVLIAVVILAVVFALCLFVLNYSLHVALIFSIVVATSMVPQGLPMEINISLLLGVRRLGKKHALVKKLSSVEALGSTSIICTDKTGTLTKNEMNVEHAFGKNFEMRIEGDGYNPKGKVFFGEKRMTLSGKKEFIHFFQGLHFNNRAHLNKKGKNYIVLGDPTEGALKVFGYRAGVDEALFEKKYQEVEEFPFDSDRKMMSTLFLTDKKRVIVHTKGSPESILAHCTHIWDANTDTKKKITKTDIQEMREKIEKFSLGAYRILAIATREVEVQKKYEQTSIEQKLTLLGFVAMMDPPRSGVKEAFRIAREAHIKTIVITGDSHLTAQAIARRVGLLNDENNDRVFTMEGKDLPHLSDHDLVKSIKGCEAAIFSRVSPEQKLRIVTQLQKSGEVVAVTGDGVNDAPALKKADIGVSMGKIGTSVAKEVSQIILTDDSYSTLVYAIKEGRTIYQNLVKTVKSCYTSNFAELFIVLIGITLASKFDNLTPLMPVQILMIDLIGEIVPLIALTFDPLRKGQMKTPPRSMKRHVLNHTATADIIFTGLLMGIVGFVVFAITYQLTHSAMMATTAAYFMLLLSQYLNILNRRESRFTFSPYFFKNWKLWVSILVTFGVLLVFVQTPLAQYEKIGFSPLPWHIWGWIAGILVMYISLLEIKKRVFFWLDHKDEMPVELSGSSLNL